MEVPVLLPKVFNYPFTYSIDEKKIKNLNQGDVVIVPFGKKREIGVVWDKINHTKKKFKLKKIEKRISNIGLNKKIIKFINWFSIYNIVPKGLILKMCLGNLKNFEVKKKNQIFKDETKKIKYILNNEQKNAIKNLISLGNKFNVSVLQGTTGSGKTLVYFERIRRLIQENKQALILIPKYFLQLNLKTDSNYFFV